MTFHVGQKVVCVDTSNRNQRGSSRPISYWLKERAVYVVRRVSNRKTSLVWVQGVNRGDYHDGAIWSDGGFFADRFHPLIERKTDITCFTEILDRENKNSRVPVSDHQSN